MSRSTATMSASLPGAPVARPVTRIGAWRAQRAGHADAAGPGPDAVTGHLPYTLRVQGQTAEAEAVIGQVLHAQIATIDRDFVSLCARIAHHHQSAGRVTTERDTAPTDVEPGSLAAANHDREQARMRAELVGHLQAGTELASRVAGLLAARRHVIDEARALVTGHAARFAQLTASHRRGYENQARRGPTAATMVLPRYAPVTPWVTGDLPILITAIDPSTRQVIDWAVQEFDRPPAHITELHAV